MDAAACIFILNPQQIKYPNLIKMQKVKYFNCLFLFDYMYNIIFYLYNEFVRVQALISILLGQKKSGDEMAIHIYVSLGIKLFF
jgi:hypothetical protein